MKTIPVILLALYIVLTSLKVSGQQFSWAKSYDISNANEVQALAVHDDGSVYLFGVFDAPWTLPFTGNAYILKTTQDGEIFFLETITGSLNVSDMAAVQEGVIMTGQSNGPFIYQGQSYGLTGYYMFVLHIDQDGQFVWLHTDNTKYGGHVNISVDAQHGIAVRTRNQSNLGDWILIFNFDGNIINSKQISASHTMIVDMAYHNGWVYLNGGFHGTAASIIVDTIEIHRPGNQNVIFVLALNTDLVASWVATDTTYSNPDGRIVVNDDGIFAYMEVVRTPFSFRKHMKKYTLDGLLIKEIEVPVEAATVAKYPDLTISPEHVALFLSNAFNHNSHKLILFDHDLNVQSEKFINGLSHLYSGQVAAHNSNLFVAHIHSGDLDFNGEITLPHAGEGRKPYLAKVSNAATLGAETFSYVPTGFHLFPNPAKHSITIQLPEQPKQSIKIQIKNLTGQTMLERTVHHRETQLATENLPAGVYFVVINDGARILSTQKFVKY